MKEEKKGLDLSLLSGIYAQAKDLDVEGIELLSPSYQDFSYTGQRYEGLCLIGKGALKEVFECFDQKTKREVAYARLRHDLDEDYYEIFIQEVWLTASLTHPNIIKILDVGVEENGSPYFTMDLKSGHSLKDEVRSGASLEQLLSTFRKVCDAVSYAHSQGIVHLDLKPENIQCDRFGEVLVCDWGLGKRVSDRYVGRELKSLPLKMQQTLHGKVRGTPGFMAPEQLDPDIVNDEKADIFALGCLLHFVLTGDTPFQGDLTEVLAQTKSGEVTPPMKRYPRAKISRGLNAVVMKCISPDMEARYSSVEELIGELQALKNGFATRAEQANAFRELQLYLGRHKGMVSFVSILCISLLSFVLIYRNQTELLEKSRALEVLKAEQLASSMEDLRSEYSIFEEAVTEDKGLLVSRLCRSADKLLYTTLYTDPIGTLEKAEILVQKALSLDPYSQSASSILAQVLCTQLNLTEVVKIDEDKINGAYRKYLRVGHRFPTFDFGAEKRPTSEQLAEFFQVMARDPQADDINLYTAMLVYHMAVVGNLSDLTAAQVALIDHYNYNTRRYQSSYSPVTRHLKLNYQWIATQGSHYGVMEDLNVDMLTLKTDQRTNLGQFDQCGVRVLDIRDVPRYNLGRKLHFRGLETLKVKGDQFSDQELKSVISSETSYDIERY